MLPIGGNFEGEARKVRVRLLIILFGFIGLSVPLRAIIQISQSDFLKVAAGKDDQFQRILAERLTTTYQEDLHLSSDDLVAKIKAEYGWDKKESGLNTTLALEKLFRDSGTKVSASYQQQKYGSDQKTLRMSLIQDIAKNALGRMNRRSAKIIGMENQIIEYQVVEAYEDYLAKLSLIYLDWYLAYENHNISRRFYNDSLRQLNNIKKRRQKNIALDIDVNKAKLQAIDKKEKMILAQTKWQKLSYLIKEAMRDFSKTHYIPKKEFRYRFRRIEFEKAWQNFHKTRTAKILGILTDKAFEGLEQSIDDLLPSTQLSLDLTRTERTTQVFPSSNQSKTDTVWLGITMEYPFSNKRKKALHAQAKTTHKKVILDSKVKKSSLKTTLYDLYQNILEQQERIETAAEMVKIAKRIVKDEKKSYTYGRTRLNDLIAAENSSQNYEFTQLTSQVNLEKSFIEWQRLTDNLLIKLPTKIK